MHDAASVLKLTNISYWQILGFSWVKGDYLPEILEIVCSSL